MDKISNHITSEGVFAILASTPYRHLLAKMYECAPEPVTGDELATHLISDGPEQKREEDLPVAVKRAHLNLHHQYLPKLEADKLIEWDREGGTVRLCNHPAFEDEAIVDAISGEWDDEDDSLDELFGAVAHPRRRAILDVLSHQRSQIHVETLARELGAREDGITGSVVPQKDLQRILTTLRHIHLPVLAEAALVAYDRDADTVAYEGHPHLRVPWMHSVFEQDFRASLTGESEPGEVSKIDGREAVISFGQWQVERAEDELFCMFTHMDMLEAGCFQRILHASRNGVTVYLGTFDPTVREFVRENAPAVVLWEPQTDWMDFPVQGNQVGRLILSDRQAVMLGTLTEYQNDDVPKEKAIVGEGSKNALVVMVVQLLRPYLDQVAQDPQSISSQLPF